MIQELDADAVVEYFRGKNILITGSTGFLGKVLVEKILRVQPYVKKLFLLVRALDDGFAKQRIQTEVTGNKIFGILKEKYELFEHIDIIVNGAATTNFFERYDVAFDSKVLGAKHVCKFAKNCAKLKMLVHVSTAYVFGEQEGLQLEKPFLMGQTLKGGTHVDIESELKLIQDTWRELKENCSSEGAEKKTMKELGLKRAREFGWPNTYVFTKAMGEMLLGHLRGELPVVIFRPSIITSILKEPLPGWTEGVRQTLSFFLADLDSIMDVIPGDIVVNAMMVTMAAHSKEHAQTIYHLTSSLRNPANYSLLADSFHRYFLHNPPSSTKNGKPMRLKRMHFFSTVTRFQVYMAVKYKLPLQILHLANIALCGVLSRRYKELNRKYNYIMLLIELYAPYTLYKGCFDDMNTERLRMRMKKKEQDKNGACHFYFDPKSIDWGDYFYRIHIPGAIKYLTN
ncbi:hypothetical protein PR202_gb25506 [Eleusine coracana subsp. coracana]|uniref:Fatty acyl-CoA reductase n=1 Tax=Eleusine coracana subsp. coracana TaxID=191504 RepID=A0AAV5FLE6_ELECO|nr:hypothetical protein PR202_gb25506 [Eleusine coracana subsp. coracana]